jgi:hypothetical protein
MTKHIKTVGIFLPSACKGESLANAKHIASLLHTGSRHEQQAINVIFSCVANVYDLEKDFADLLALGIRVRETEWKLISKREMDFIQHIAGLQRSSLLHEMYMMPADGISNFYDCDWWLTITDRFPQPLAPIKPYGMVIYDYQQRYAPDSLGDDFNDANYISTARRAHFIFTPTTAARDDAIQYAGLAPHRVHHACMNMPPFPENKDKLASEFWQLFSEKTAEADA